MYKIENNNEVVSLQDNLNTRLGTGFSIPDALVWNYPIFDGDEVSMTVTTASDGGFYEITGVYMGRGVASGDAGTSDNPTYFIIKNDDGYHLIPVGLVIHIVIKKPNLLGRSKYLVEEEKEE